MSQMKDESLKEAEVDIETLKTDLAEYSSINSSLESQLQTI